MLNIENEELLVKSATRLVKTVEHDLHWIAGEPDEIVIALRADKLGAYLEYNNPNALDIRYRFSNIEDIAPQCQLFLSVVRSLQKFHTRYRIEADDGGDVLDRFGAYMLRYSIDYTCSRPGVSLNRRGGEKYLPAA